MHDLKAKLRYYVANFTLNESFYSTEKETFQFWLTLSNYETFGFRTGCIEPVLQISTLWEAGHLGTYAISSRAVLPRIFVGQKAF